MNPKKFLCVPIHHGFLGVFSIARFSFYSFFDVLFSFFIYRKVCASETCKGPCKIASEFQVSRWRAVAASNRAERKEEEEGITLKVIGFLG